MVLFQLEKNLTEEFRLVEKKGAAKKRFLYWYHYCVASFFFLLVFSPLKVEQVISEQDARGEEIAGMSYWLPIVEEVHWVSAILKDFPTGLEEDEKDRLAETVVFLSLEYGWDPLLILAIMRTESSFYNWSRSPLGALGLMQVRPFVGRAVAKKAAVEWDGAKTLMDPDRNLRIGIHYFNYLHKQFDDLEWTLTAYNRGPTWVRSQLKQGKTLSNQYFQKVIASYREFVMISNEVGLKSGNKPG